jgi:hypothetical protein
MSMDTSKMKDIQYSPLSSEVFHIHARDEIGTFRLTLFPAEKLDILTVI